MKPIGLSMKATGVALGGEEKPLSRATVYRRIADGTLEAIKFGGRTLVTMESIERAVADAPRVGA